MDSWAVFAGIYQHFDQQFVAGVQTVVTTVASGMQKPLLLAATLYIAATFAIEMYSPGGGSPVLFMIRKFVRVAFVLALGLSANYVTIFDNWLLVQVGGAIASGVTGAPDAGGVQPSAFDTLFGQGWVALVEIIKNVSIWEPKTVLLALMAAGLMCVGALFIAIAFIIFILTHITLALAVEVGPIFIAFLLFEATVGWFRAWINTLLAALLAQILLVLLLETLIAVETNILQQMLALNGAGAVNADNIGAQLHYYVEAVILYFMIGYLSPKIERFASGLAQASAPPIARLSEAAHGLLASGARAAATAATGGAAAAGAAYGATGSVGAAMGAGGSAGMRSLKIAGRGS